MLSETSAVVGEPGFSLLFSLSEVIFHRLTADALQRAGSLQVAALGESRER